MTTPLRVPAVRVEAVRSMVGEIIEERRLEVDAEQRAAVARRHHPATRRVAFAAALAVSAAAWFTPAGWLVPAAAPAPSATFTDASGRLSLYLAGQQVEYFRIVHKRLPSSLAELGRRLAPGIRYARLGDDDFELRLGEGARTLRYTSGLPPEALMGATMQRLGGEP